jgi:hypothetical protein
LGCSPKILEKEFLKNFHNSPIWAIFVSTKEVITNKLKKLRIMNQPVDNRFSADQIFKAIESISQRFISCFHDEANGYAFKYTDGTWGTAKYNFVHDIALGYDKDGKRRYYF